MNITPAIPAPRRNTVPGSGEDFEDRFSVGWIKTLPILLKEFKSWKLVVEILVSSRVLFSVFPEAASVCIYWLPVDSFCVRFPKAAAFCISSFDNDARCPHCAVHNSAAQMKQWTFIVIPTDAIILQQSLSKISPDINKQKLLLPAVRHF